MTRAAKIAFQFVEFIPAERASNTLYISTEYATAVHDCLCGCGTKVVTPLHPTGWTLSFDGETVSLNPSIGNWGYPCRSHYVIDRSRIKWAADMSEQAIEHGRRHDHALRGRHFGGASIAAPVAVPQAEESVPAVMPTTPVPRKSLWRRLLGL